MQQSLPSPRVTVIIPAYKALTTLEKAVKSVLAQTEPDWELIIIEDCSPDATGQLADRLAERDARIRVIHLPHNRGKAAAMNYATAEARGRWIALLDSDDWYAPSRLQHLLDAGEAADVTMVTDNQVLYDLKAKRKAGTALPPLGGNRRLNLDIFLRHSDPAANFDYGMLKPIFRADFIRAQKIAYYEPASIGEDHLLLLAFFASGGTGLLVDAPLYYYLQPFGTLSRQWAQEGRKRYNFELLEQINGHGIAQWRHRLTAEQLAILQRRGMGIAAMARLHQLREAVSARDIIGIIQRLRTAPWPFWRLLAMRITGKMRRLLLE